MNIAICISGEPRYLEHIESSLVTARKYCKQHGFTLHIFYHLWDTVTKRQKEIKQEPVIEQIQPEYLESLIQPTIGICQSKNILDPEVEYCYNYINSLIDNIEIYNNKKNTEDIYMLSRDLSKFKTQIKLSNHPPYSQLSSICKCQMIRIEYEEKNNIFYDVVVRTRTDVQFTFPKIDKLTKSIRFLTGTRPSVFFPGLWVRGFNNIGVEYCFFVGSSRTLNRILFQNYKQDIPEILFKIKHAPEKPKLMCTTSHNSIPTLMYKYEPKLMEMKTRTEIRCSMMGFKQKIHQMEKLF